jgi:RimJ/RimL family protein N-acetyltransferase
VNTAIASRFLDLARAWPSCMAAEIRCHPANAASAGVPSRLGFTLVASHDSPPLDVWQLAW